MKLMLLTPVIKSSAIGRMASLIARKLIADGHEIIVVRTEDKSYFNNPIHDFGTEPIAWYENTQVHTFAHTVDVMIYQIGDNFELHQGCLALLAQFSGIVCLHDFSLGNLFYGWARHHRPAAHAILRTWYGSKAAKQFFYYHDPDSRTKGTSAIPPMTEWLCAMAQGVITHSNWGVERVLRSCSGPVRRVPFAVDAQNLVSANAKKDKLDILTVGDISKNTRVASVITALGKNRLLRENSIYRLVGSITPENRNALSALARRRKVNLVISAEVDDSSLANAIAEADIVSCLRWPTFETASASTIEAMLYGKPTIVTNTGFYSEIPDNCAIKINPAKETPELGAVFKQLSKNPQQFHAVGQQGQQWAASTFTVDNYALKLIEMVLSTSRSKVVLNAINHFSQLMHTWGARGEELLGKEYTLEPLSIFQGRH